jgi:high-affinity Fe2+/Pb2+ permease
MWLYFFIIYFCGIWAFSSSRKHLLITLLRLEFVVLVLYFSIYFYLCRFNYGLFNRIGDVALLMVIAWMINFGGWSFIYYLEFSSGSVEME